MVGTDKRGTVSRGCEDGHIGNEGKPKKQREAAGNL